MMNALKQNISASIKEDHRQFLAKATTVVGSMGMTGLLLPYQF